jgi:hypothetical protein
MENVQPSSYIMYIVRAVYCIIVIISRWKRDGYAQSYTEGVDILKVQRSILYTHNNVYYIIIFICTNVALNCLSITPCYKKHKIKSLSIVRLSDPFDRVNFKPCRCSHRTVLCVIYGAQLHQGLFLSQTV